MSDTNTASSTATAVLTPTSKPVMYIWVSAVDNTFIKAKVRTRGRPPAGCETLPRADGNFYITVQPSPISAGPVADISAVAPAVTPSPAPAVKAETITEVKPTGEISDNATITIEPDLTVTVA